MLKNIALTLLSLCLLLSLTACQDYQVFTRSDQQVIIQLVGIDYSPDNQTYTVSVQYCLGGDSDDNQDGNMKTAYADGRNISHAIRQIHADTGKELFFHHTQVILLGQEVLATDTLAAIEGYLNHCSCHSTALVTGVHGRAKDILSLTFKNEFFPQNRILIIVKSANDVGAFPIYDIGQVLANSYSTSRSFFLPMLKVQDFGGQNGDGEENEKNEEAAEVDSEDATADPTVSPHGGAVMIDGKAATFADETQCRGLALFTSTAASSIKSIEFEHDGEVHTIEKFKSKLKIEPAYDAQAQRLIVRINFSAVADKHSAYHQALRELIEPAERAIEASLLDAALLMSEHGGDLIKLEDTLKHRDYKTWETLTQSDEQWRETLRNAEYVINADLKIV
ncbi:MAG: hypothetical protein FWG45_01085 [Oscillospiraceae bacterium]|nr:hypothetical protein [Oscillospiraceae bacterium]